MLYKFQSIFILLLFGLCCCTRKASAPVQEGDTLHLEHARLLTLIHYADHDEALIRDPWKPDALLHRYVLVPRSDLNKWQGRGNGTIIGVPLQRCVMFTASHTYLLRQLEALSAVVGVCDARYMHSPDVERMLLTGAAIDCGDGMQPDAERIVQACPEALFLSPFEHSGGYGALDKMGIPLVECADYMEATALGRAEWMKFYGLLMGKTVEADSLFAVVEENYRQLKTAVGEETRTPLVLTERLTGSVWYCPGGKSTMATLIGDAHATHLLSGDGHSGSVPLSAEQVVARGQDIDLWLFHAEQTDGLTRRHLLNEWQGCTAVRAFREGNVYVCNSLRSAYFDEIPFRPDWLLREIILMSHPDGAVKGPLRYYRKL